MTSILKRLEKYLDNIRRAQLLEAQIAEMFEKNSPVAITGDTVLDYRHRKKGKPVHITGFDERKYKRLKRKLADARKDIAAAEAWIEDIEDDVTREVFEGRYVHGWSWMKIANRIGYQGNEDYPRLYIRDKYLKQLGLK